MREDYELMGVFVHKGCFTSSGHYTSYLMDSLHQWYKYDDEVIRRVTEQEIAESAGGGHTRQYRFRNGEILKSVLQNSSTAYMLAYVRKSRFREVMSTEGRVGRVSQGRPRRSKVLYLSQENLIGKLGFGLLHNETILGQKSA